jgi:large conductance mechanosensitive channel
MLKEFRDFALKGNALDMAVGIIIGAAFGTIVNSLVNDILMPPIGLMLGRVDFSNIFLTLKAGIPPGPYLTAEAAADAGAITVNFGIFINNVISFVIIAFTVFLVVKNFNKVRDKFTASQQVDTKECPECCSKISIRARKCPNCTTSFGK